MRVVAGSLRGRRIDPPPDGRARPTSDRVREAMFNALGSMRVIEEADVLDLFAGTGALGIEALSRGARHATFVENDRRMLGVLRGNLHALDLAGRARVVAGRADVALEAWRASGERFDVALLDPPYAFDDWTTLLASLPAPLALIESDRPPLIEAPWGVARAKRYGGTIVTIVQRSEPASDAYSFDQAQPEGSGPGERRGEQ
jgi:16S rRNA (guanine966-N2)-methyltransferase